MSGNCIPFHLMPSLNKTSFYLNFKYPLRDIASYAVRGVLASNDYFIVFDDD